MSYTVSVSADEELSDFLNDVLIPEFEWASQENVIDGYSSDLVGFVLGEEDIQGNIEVSVTYATKDKIAKLNAEYRDINKPTDVLSFPCDNPADVEKDALCELGDIVISPEVAYEQAKEYGNSFADEITLLLTHGVLHLLGYDHVENDDASIMESRERDLREAWQESK